MQRAEHLRRSPCAKTCSWPLNFAYQCLGHSSPQGRHERNCSPSPWLASSKHPEVPSSSYHYYWCSSSYRSSCSFWYNLPFTSTSVIHLAPLKTSSFPSLCYAKGIAAVMRETLNNHQDSQITSPFLTDLTLIALDFS
jgi:hypothetical protein